MSEHHDALEQLNKHLPLTDKLVTAHRSLNQIYPFVTRIAVTLYDPETKILKTYLNSSDDENPLEHYQTLIDDAPSLKKLLDEGIPRVINTMLTFDNDGREHTTRIGRQGYAASYTLPMFNDGVFFGFIFFNSAEEDVFTEHVLSQIDVYGHMISLMIINVFDALTSRRPYKEAWANDRAITTLQQLSGEKLDKDCVQALLNNMDEVVKIQKQFSENKFG